MVLVLPFGNIAGQPLVETGVLGVARGGTGPGAYAPTDLGSALLLWLDGQDATRLFADTTETTLAPDGGVVGRWKDKSGMSRHADQGTPGARPFRSDTAVNGHRGLTSDATRGLVAPTLGAITAFELWVVVSSAEGVQVIAENYVGAGNFFTLYRSAYQHECSVAGVAGSFGLAFSGSAPALVRLAVDTTLATDPVLLEVDGLAAGSGANTGLGTVLSADSLYLGRRYDGSYGLSGAVGELVVAGRRLTAGEASSLRAYLQGRWGTP